MIEWPAYNKEDDKYMYMADPLEIKTGFSKIKPESTPAWSSNMPVEEKAE